MNTLHFSCTSLELAKQFGKNHAAVMRAVCRLLQNLPKSYAALHFKKLPSAYAISHEGVLLLFSSFTGKKSLAPKIRWLEEQKKTTEQDRLWEIALTREIALSQGAEYAKSCLALPECQNNAQNA